MLPGPHALAATSCTDGPAAGVPVAASEGVTRTDFTFAHRVEGQLPDPRHPGARRRPPSPPRRVPVILALHGLDGSPDSLAPLLDGWVAAGLRRGGARRSRRRRRTSRARRCARRWCSRRPTLATCSTRCSTAPPTFDIDPDEVGAAGMSLGGLTVYALDLAHRVARTGASRPAVVMSGVHDPLPSGRYEHQDVPVLLLHGDADTGYRHSRERVRAARAAEVVRHAARRASRAAVRGAAQSAISTVVDATTTSHSGTIT